MLFLKAPLAVSHDRQVHRPLPSSALPPARCLERPDGCLSEHLVPQLSISSLVIQTRAPKAAPSTTAWTARDSGRLAKRPAARKIEAPQGLKVFAGLPEKNLALSRNVGGERFHAPIQNSREHATTCPLSGRISVRPQRRRRRAESAAAPRPQTAPRGLQSRLWMQPAPHGSGTRAHSSTGRLQACLPLSGLRAG